jgi:hypothetical protein
LNVERFSFYNVEGELRKNMTQQIYDFDERLLADAGMFMIG